MPTPAPPAPARLTLATSACLAGERVRYDGGHKHDHYLTGTLSEWFDLLPFCPERDLGVPRPPIHLVSDGGGIRARTDDGRDVTEALETFAAGLGGALRGVDGMVLKARSPSCGPDSIPTGDGGRSVAGVVAAWIRRHHPLLPAIDEERLGIAAWREAFLTAALVHHNWRTQVAAAPSPAALVAFHTAHKLTILAHHQASYRKMGPLVATAGTTAIGPLCDAYASLLMGALAHPAERGGHLNVLQHLAGYLKDRIDGAAKAELAAGFAAYRDGRLPLAAPVTLLNHYFRLHPHPHAAEQFYLHRPWWP